MDSSMVWVVMSEDGEGLRGSEPATRATAQRVTPNLLEGGRGGTNSRKRSNRQLGKTDTEDKLGTPFSASVSVEVSFEV